MIPPCILYFVSFLFDPSIPLERGNEDRFCEGLSEEFAVFHRLPTRAKAIAISLAFIYRETQAPSSC